MNVTKRDGNTEAFNEDKILACIDRACNGDQDRVQRVFMNAKIKGIIRYLLITRGNF